MIYVDELFDATAYGYESERAATAGKRHGHRWCHLWSDDEDLESLHAFAASLGLRRSWFQDRPRFPHYDLAPSKRAIAIRLGAKEVNLRDWLTGRMKQKSLSENGPTDYKETK